jgi:hypothetical protein
MDKKRNISFCIEFPKSIIVADDMEDFEKQAATIAAECRKLHPNAEAEPFSFIAGGVIMVYDTGGDAGDCTDTGSSERDGFISPENKRNLDMEMAKFRQNISYDVPH